jgi:hypothetical protein
MSNVQLNAFEKMIQEAVQCSDVQAQRLFKHADIWDDVDWSEITMEELAQNVEVWKMEMQVF